MKSKDREIEVSEEDDFGDVDVGVEEYKETISKLQEMR